MAEQVQGPKAHSYNLTVETKVNMDELIYLLNPQDLPLQTGVGSDGLSIVPTEPVDNRVFYWLVEDVPLPRGTLNADIDNAVTSIALTAGHGVRFAVGDVLLLDSEIVSVTANASDTLTVVRASSGTSAAAHTAATCEVIGLGTVLQEGNIGVANFRGRDSLYNYTQIFSKKLQITRTEQRIPKYGVPNELNKQVLNNMLNLSVGVEQSGLYGVRYEDSATQRRQTAGLMSMITTNVNTSDPWLVVEGVEARQSEVYDLGGMIDILMARPKAFQALNNITGVERIQTVTIDDARRGRMRARTLITEFGEVTLVRNRWMKRGDAVGYRREQFVKRVMDPLTLQPLAKTDDTDIFMMLTELGWMLKGQEHAVKWTGLNYNAPFPVDLV